MAPLVDVTETAWGLEFSIHEIPKTHTSEVQAIFPGEDLTGMLVVPTCQRAAMELVNVGPDVDAEKDRLLERFFEFAKGVCGKLEAEGFWADYIDPCSGLPMIHKFNGAVYSEVDALTTLLRYKTQNAGCCKIILHPRWGSAVYPSSLFTKAPLDRLTAAIRATEEQLKGASA